MGGVYTVGDLVARAMMEKKLKLKKAKEYVAKKLDIDTIELLTDRHVTRKIREELDIGGKTLGSVGLEAKTRIGEILDYKINSVQKFFEKTRKRMLKIPA